MKKGRPNKALQQNRDEVLRYGESVGCDLLKAAVMLRDPSNLNGPCCSGAGIKIDFAGSLGQNDKGWRKLALGPGLTLGWTIGGPWGEAQNNLMHAEFPSAVIQYPMLHLRQPGDAGPLCDGRRVI